MLSRRLSRQASAVIAGAGSGIGRVFALELAARSGRVACSDITLEQAKATADLTEQAGGCALATACDVTKRADVEAVVEVAEVWLGGSADLVVRNAVVGAGGHAIGDMTIVDCMPERLPGGTLSCRFSTTRAMAPGLAHSV